MLFPVGYSQPKTTFLSLCNLAHIIPNGKLDTDLSNVFELNSNSRRRGHAFELRKLRCNLDTWDYFTIRVVNLWNNLPENVVAATTVSIFRNHLAVVTLI